MKTLVYIVYSCEVLSLVIGLAKLNTFKKVYIKLLILLLSINVITESVFLFIYKPTHNILFYNLLSLISFNILFVICYKNLTHKLKLVLSGIITYNIIYLINVLNIEFTYQLTTISNITGGVLVSTFIIFYYIELLSSSKVLYLKNNPFYWFTIGGLLYYSGSIPFELAVNKNLKDYTEIFYINHILYIIYYLCITIGLLLHKSQTTSSPY